MTICTLEKKHILSTVGRDDPGAPPKTELSLLGSVVEKYILSIPASYKNVSVEKYVIMPNHVHILLTVAAGAPGSSRPTISQIIGAWKRLIYRETGKKLFQASFHDHVIRDENDFSVRWKYIDENPAKWDGDEYYTKK